MTGKIDNDLHFEANSGDVIQVHDTSFAHYTKYHNNWAVDQYPDRLRIIYSSDYRNKNAIVCRAPYKDLCCVNECWEDLWLIDLYFPETSEYITMTAGKNAHSHLNSDVFMSEAEEIYSNNI